jgi:hypothetical protein
MKTALIVAPQFPPSPLAAVHRPRHLARHLPSHGWKPVVVRVDEAFYAERLDHELARLVPASVEQVRTRALSGRLTRLGGIGDIGLRAYPYLGAAIDGAVAAHRPSVVFFTGFPFYPMLLGGRIKRRHGLPLALDFQDPWVSAYGASLPPLSKEGLAHRLAVALEPRVLRHADFVTGVSQTQNDDMAARYPWLDRARMAAIPIGGDPDDFDAVRGVVAQPGSGLIELRYVGAFWPRAEPCVRQLMRGLALLREREPALAKRLRLSFTGTRSGNLPGEELPRPVAAIAEQEGVGELVEEHPQRAPFVEALRLMASAPGLILVGSDEPHYTASKIYPTLMSGRPYLSLFHGASSAHAVLAAAGGGIALGFGSDAELTGMSEAIAEGLTRVATQPESLGRADPAAYAAYTAHAVAGQFAAIFDRLAAERLG